MIMELLCVLEPEESPHSATWYAFVPSGESPDVRVGHTLTYIPDKSGKGKVIIVGGANPNGSYSDAYVLELDRHEWDAPKWKGLLPRYEHASFVPVTTPTGLWLFGGADECGNRNCIQVLNFETGEWRSPITNGTPPSPRTCHGSTAAVGNCLYVFGGGDKGAEPVQDPQLHAFDKATLRWSQKSTGGKPPAPRHGHVMVAVGSKLFIHGGLAGDRFFNDMYTIDTAAVNMMWEKINMKGDIPDGRAAHSAVSHEKYIFIFGGLDATGALNTMYKYHIETQCWTLLEFDSSLPTKRLDHAMCIIPWKIRKAETDTPGTNEKLPAEENEECTSGNNLHPTSMNCSAIQSQTKSIVHLCLVFGGMDTQGEIFNDCFVTLLKGC